MFITEMPLDVSKEYTEAALSKPVLFHGAIEEAFPGERTRKLWRVDHTNDKWYLLIVSEDAPDLSSVVEQFGYDNTDGSAWITKCYDKLVDKINEGDIWHFHLVANPTYSRIVDDNKVDKKGHKIRKVFAHTTAKSQKKWLVGKGPSQGFSVDENQFNVSNQGWINFRKKDNREHEVSIFSVDYDGFLKITDKKLFQQTLLSGIGRGKAYGMGLLTVG